MTTSRLSSAASKAMLAVAVVSAGLVPYGAAAEPVQEDSNMERESHKGTSPTCKTLIK